MNWRRLLLTATLLAFFTATAVMAYPNNFTPVFNDTQERVHLNQTYVIADQAATPFMEWLFCALTGLSLFLLSCILSCDPRYQEVDSFIAALSTPPTFIAAFTSNQIDIVTSYGTSAISGAGQNYVYATELHTIYHFDYTAIMLWLLMVCTILNMIRIMLHKRNLQALAPET